MFITNDAPAGIGDDLRKRFIILTILLSAAGCSAAQPLSNEAEKRTVNVVPVAAVQAPQAPPSSPGVPFDNLALVSKRSAAALATNRNSEAGSILTGIFSHTWPNPLNEGIAEVTKTDEDTYHLQVSVVHGFSHHMGEIDSNFTFDGTNIIFANDDCTNVSFKHDGERAIGPLQKQSEPFPYSAGLLGYL